MKAHGCLHRGFGGLLVVILLGAMAWCLFNRKPVIYNPAHGYGISSPLAAERVAGADDPASWVTFTSGPEISLERLAGRSGPALRMHYSFAETNVGWVVSSLAFRRVLPESARLGFWVRSGGQPANLELKIIDADGGIFARTFSNQVGNPEWRWLETDLRVLSYVWGGSNKVMDAADRLELAVSRNAGNMNEGDGWVEVEGLSLLGANPRLELAMSQVGFDTDAPKHAVLRLVNLPTGVAGSPRVTVVPRGWNFPVMVAAVSNRGEHAWGGTYWVADFSKLKVPWAFELVAELMTPDGPLRVRSYPFEVGRRIVARRTGLSQFHYIRSTRYPTNHPHVDPVPGGYYDTEFDIEKWMTTTPTWVWGMARFMRCFPGGLPGGGYDALDELQYAVDFMLAMQDPQSGGVYVAVNGTWGIGWLAVKVENDPQPRVLTRTHELPVNTAYAAAMAEAAMAMRPADSNRSEACLNAAILAWKWCVEKDPSETPDVGNLLWASMRLYEAAGGQVYLDTARKMAERILPRQFLDPARSADGIYGRFFRTSGGNDFNYQYKYVHAVGIELGLMELAGSLPVGDPLRRQIVDAMTIYMEKYLANSAARNPYGEIATGLELDSTTGLFRAWHLTPPWAPVAHHGLNCDILSAGLVAARFARLTGDRSFNALAWDQLQWVLGQNPFGFCMISGIGQTNPWTMAEYWDKGPTLGGLVNGLVAAEVQDTPCYRDGWHSDEYWKPHNAMFLALTAELEGEPPRP
ncbi:MAG: glycoside hydrolase family 9 protein [bacterium]